MTRSSVTDIVCLLRHLVEALRPFAKARKVELSFHPDREEWVVDHNPEKIVADFAPLICHIIAYMPEHHQIRIRTQVLQESEGDKFRVSIQNTGIDLSYVNEIPLACRQPLKVIGAGTSGTTFELAWSFAREETAGPSTVISPARQPGQQPETFLPAFYAEIRKRLQSHFTKSENIVAALSIYHPKEASFLREVNAIIEANLDTEGFDVARLSASMNMSRVQLYRRLKPLIRQAPAEYIKLLRLQKAKQLLETTGLRMGEIAYRTGFQSQSHFTKVFTDQYGMPPSLFSRNNRNVTKQ
jgi:AraC-like DNA-binding protein